MKKCKECGVEKDNSEFFIRKKNNKPYGRCKDCLRIDSKKRLTGYKKKAVEAFGGKCMLCGYNKYVGALEFHHLNPSEKDERYNSMRNWSFDRKKEESEKCVLLCSNCHKEVEAGVAEIRVAY